MLSSPTSVPSQAAAFAVVSRPPRRQPLVPSQMALRMTELVDPMSSFLSQIDLQSLDYPLEAAKIGLLPTTCAAFFLWLAASRPPSRLLSPSQLESVLTGTFLERQQPSNVRCVYKGSRDGWSALAFHEAVDGLGSALVVARSIGGQTFGGYNPNGFRSTDDYYTSSAAFLWCCSSSMSIVKLPVLAGGNGAVFDYATAGPCFGAADLLLGPPRAAVMGGFAGPNSEDLTAAAGSLQVCRSAVGSAYQFHPAWPARGTTRLVEVEVYAVGPSSPKRRRRRQ